MQFISTTNHLIRELQSLPVEKFIIATDEEDNEYVIENICQRKIHGDSDLEWCYALKIRSTEGCIKR